jgi:protein-S-isoprenylcysteine O-methyltransferase Ste14
MQRPPLLRSRRRRLIELEFFTPRAMFVIRMVMNLVGAAGAALFALASIRHYRSTHTLIGAAFVAEQLWIVVAYLVRRPARTVSRRFSDWTLAFCGTFAGVLFRPTGAHPHWGVGLGLGVQVVGLAIAVLSLRALGRSFGFAAADRGLVQRGPYAVVRHPIYVSYVLLQLGYVLQSISLRNAFVMVFASSCNFGRARAEERHLSGSGQYDAYRAHVRWRMFPGIW